MFSWTHIEFFLTSIAISSKYAIVLEPEEYRDIGTRFKGICLRVSGYLHIIRILNLAFKNVTIIVS